MAALYLHNASPQSHNRQLSNTSTGPNSIQTDISTGQPLLRHSTTHSDSAYGEINRNVSSKEHRSMKEKLHIGRGWGNTDRARTRSQKRHWPIRLAQITLELVIAVWAVYTTVRYFLAYTRYTSTEGQAIVLALGTVTTVSFALLLAERILAASVSYLVSQGLPASSLRPVRLVLRIGSCGFLMVPALAAFILLFTLRSTQQPELRLSTRCRLDVDVAWSFSQDAPCDSPPQWNVWLGLSIVRLFGTLIVVSLYHFVVVLGHRTTSPRSKNAQKAQSEAYVTQFTSFPPSFRASPNSYPQSSQSIIDGNSSPPAGRSRSLRRTRSQSTVTSSSRVELAEAMTPLDSFSPYSSFPASASSSPPLPLLTDDRELYSFVDRFRSLVSQISRETEEGIQRPESPVANFDEIYGTAGFGYDMTPPQPPTYYRGLDEFGRPFPPEEHVRVLGGYIRRMPTIESMGSHEVTSLYDHRQRVTSTSTSAYSSPVEGPSRANSLAASSHMSMMYMQISDTVPAEGTESRRPSLSMSIGSGSNSRSTTQSYHTAYGSGNNSMPSSPLYASYMESGETQSSPLEEHKQLSV